MPKEAPPETPLSERMEKLADALELTQDIVRQGAYAVRQCQRERDNAVDGHEGQRRNTLAFMREAEAAKREIERLRRGLTIITNTADVDADTCATIAKRYLDGGEW